MVKEVHASQESGLGFQDMWGNRADQLGLIRLDQQETAEVTFTRGQVWWFVMIPIAIVGASLLGFHKVLIVLSASLTLLYFAFSMFKGLLAMYSTRSGLMDISGAEVAALREEDLPTWSVLAPCYKEKAALPELARALSRMDWPKDRLQVLLLIREEDEETLSVARSLDLPPFFTIVLLGPHHPKTKPSALNLALPYVTGEYFVIYDAESRPEPAQFKKAWIAFQRSKRSVIAVQAQTLVRNHNTNLLTKFFAAEYCFYHPMVVPGLAKLGAPIPMPGSSVHFRTSYIKELGGWDPFNVAEDCDLGIRIARHRGRMVSLKSVSWEEAPIHIKTWVRQRTRWIKGFMQTWLVHMRSPRRLIRDMGLVNFVYFQLMVGVSTLVLLVNPIFWALTIIYLITGSEFLRSLYPGPVLYIGMLNLMLGNLLAVVFAQIGSDATGAGGNAKYMLLAPLYWLLMSVAAFRALYQLVRAPHVWELTPHGLVPENETHQPAPQASELVGVGEQSAD